MPEKITEEAFRRMLADMRAEEALDEAAAKREFEEEVAFEMAANR